MAGDPLPLFGLGPVPRSTDDERVPRRGSVSVGALVLNAHDVPLLHRERTFEEAGYLRIGDKCKSARMLHLLRPDAVNTPVPAHIEATNRVAVTQQAG
jgi:hypothetical protein